MNPFCKYKDMFGKPNTGIHRHRVLGVAIMDVLPTLLIALLVAWFFGLPYGWTIVAFFAAGIAAHRLFCVRTTVDRMLFP
jgi:hypothetical protein